MNLTPSSQAVKSDSRNSLLKGRTLDVWRFLLGIARQTAPPTKRFQVSRREIQKGAGVGSLNTVDEALERLEAFGLLMRDSLPGSNEGYIYELLTLDENPIPNINRWGIAALLRQVADTLERDTMAMTPEQISKWSGLVYKARQLLD
jgi:hypothetical protein